MDMCKNCISRGDLGRCMAASCNYHDLWMIKAVEKKYQREIIKLVSSKKELKICPLMSYRIDRLIVKCYKEDCGLWEEDRCAVRGIVALQAKAISMFKEPK